MTDQAPQEESPKNIYQFKLHKEPATIKLKPYNFDECEHRKLELDVEGRLIKCGLCKKALDPWKALKLIQRWFSERDYKWEAIQEHNKREAERRKKEHERREAKRKKECRICHDSERHLCTGWHCDVCGAPIAKDSVLCDKHAMP